MDGTGFFGCSALHRGSPAADVLFRVRVLQQVILDFLQLGLFQKVVHIENLGLFGQADIVDPGGRNQNIHGQRVSAVFVQGANPQNADSLPAVLGDLPDHIVGDPLPRSQRTSALSLRLE